jgi:4'-phosphopantetheinyl transferase
MRADPDQSVSIRIMRTDLGAEAEAELSACLDSGERVRADRFHFAPDRQSYVAAHALLRRLPAARLGSAPAALRFETEPRGRPRLVGGPADFAFSLSHSHSRGVVAVAAGFGPDLGIDIEAVPRPRLNPARVAASFCADERAWVEAGADADERERRLLTLWTLKEVLAKATGEGLARPLDAVSFADGSECPRFADPGTAAGWRFRSFAAGAWIAAIAARDGDRPRAFEAIEVDAGGALVKTLDLR